MGNHVDLPEQVLQKVILYEVPVGSKIKAEGSTLEVTIFDESPQKVKNDTILYDNNTDSCVDEDVSPIPTNDLKIYKA